MKKSLFNFCTFTKLRFGASHLALGPIPTVAVMVAGELPLIQLRGLFVAKNAKLQVQN